MRGVTPLEIGDVFTPIYTGYMTSDTSMTAAVDKMDTSWTVYNSSEFTVTWDGTQKVTVEELQDDVPLKLAFRLHDIFGGYTTTPLIDFNMN